MCDNLDMKINDKNYQDNSQQIENKNSLRFHKLMILLLVFLFISNLFLINRPVADNDEGIYLTTFSLIQRGHQAYQETFLSQPPGFLLSVFPGFLFLGKTLQAARTTLVVWSVVGMISLFWLGYKLKNLRFAFLAISLLYLMPSYFNQTITFQSDILPVTFSLLSLVFLLIPGGKTFGFIVSAFFLNFAFWTKFDVSAVPAIIYLLIYYKEKALRQKLSGVFILISVLFLLILILPFGLRNILVNSVAYRFQASGMYSFSLMPLLNFIQKDMILSSVLLVNILFIFKRNHSLKFPNIIFLIWMVSVIFILLLYKPVFPHHLVMLAVPSVLFFSCSLLSALRGHKKILNTITVLIVFIMVSSRVYYVQKTPMGILNNEQKMAVQEIEKNTGINDLVVTDEEILNGVSGRLPPPELSDVSFVRIQSNNLSPDKFKEIIELYHPKMIIPWNGRLESIGSLSESLRNYRELTTIKGSKKFLIRKD